MTDESNAKGDRETELLKWQHDAGLPHPPTSFTIDYRKAIDDAEGPRAYDWVDKPHRLVFDLCRYIEEREVRHRIASTHAQPDSALARVVDTAIQKVMDSHPLAEPVKLNLHEAAAIRAALLGGAGDGLVSEDAVSHALLLHNRGLVNVPDDTEQGFTTYYECSRRHRTRIYNVLQTARSHGWRAYLLLPVEATSRQRAHR